MKPRLVTIGVYGFEKESFFQALQDAQVDLFCDIRLRRGMRGSKYAFVNSEQLQQRLRELNIRYLHAKALAPSQAIREKQHQEDAISGIGKRDRIVLRQSFVEAYKEECLSTFNSNAFLENLRESPNVICLFCVEREPEACHRSLIAKRFAEDLDIKIEHLKS